jgi:acetylornithine deacetylase
VAAVVDEEHASLGAEALAAAFRADAAVVTEPTDLAVCIGHKGFSWIEVETTGRAAHGSRPDEGRDAILRMGRVLGRLEALDRELQSRAPHPVLGTASLHASLVEGGRELSTYPDHCVLRLERRTLLGEPEQIALRELKQILAALRREDPEFEATAHSLLERRPYGIDTDHELPQALAAAVARIGRVTRLAGATFWTDAAVLGHAGTPSVVFGPGGAGLHGLEEYVRVDEVLGCREALVELVRGYCEIWRFRLSCGCPWPRRGTGPAPRGGSRWRYGSADGCGSQRPCA